MRLEESAKMRKVSDLVRWCSDNSLQPKAEKNKTTIELISLKEREMWETTC